MKLFDSVLDQNKSSSAFLDRKVMYSTMISHYGQEFRFKLMNWLVYIGMRFSSSDEALLHGIKMAENALTKFHSDEKNQSSSQSKTIDDVKFMMIHPQYCYLVSFFICVKMHDLTYPIADLFLKESQKISNQHIGFYDDSKSIRRPFF